MMELFGLFEMMKITRLRANRHGVDTGMVVSFGLLFLLYSKDVNV